MLTSFGRERKRTTSVLTSKFFTFCCVHFGLWQGAKGENPPTRGCDRRATRPLARGGATRRAAVLFGQDFFVRCSQIQKGYACHLGKDQAKNRLHNENGLRLSTPESQRFSESHMNAGRSTLFQLLISRGRSGRILPCRLPWRRLWFLAIAIGCLQALTLFIHAATAAPVTGLIYYSVENQDADRVEQRGTAGSAGVAFDRLILGSNTRYRIWLLEAATLRVAEVEIATANPGQRLTLPDFNFRQASSHDTDGDQLSDLGEFILGTDPLKPDTDGDGIRDGAEVRQGNDPLSGRAVRTGIIGTADTPGEAFDICAVNDLAVVADRQGGVSVFNVFGGMNPTLIARVDTPGDALAVACSGNWIVVADSTAGLAIINIADPPASQIVHQLNLGSSVLAVTVAGPIAYAGLLDGNLVMIDIATGAVLDRLALKSGAVQDVTVGGDTLYALVVGKLYALSLDEGGLRISSSVDSPGGLGAGRRRLRLFAGDSVLYATYLSGYNIFNISSGDRPSFVRTVTTTQFGWKQIVGNGSGLGLAAVGPNSTDDGRHDISLYNAGADGTANEFRTTLETPGLAAAVSIYNGLAYVADSAAGLQVVNYLAYDALGVPPSIALRTSFTTAAAEEGKLMRLMASVTDDVQVRNVEFYVDGIKVATDGNFPFEHRLLTPLIAAGKTSFTTRARASDTGGNAAWSDELTLRLVPDATPPRVTRMVPFNGALVGAVRSVSAYFSEPLNAVSVNAATVRLLSAGADGLFGTADDVTPTGVLEYREAVNGVFVQPPDRLAPGNYRFTLSPPLADLAGNALAGPATAQFRVFSFTDEDQDGMPDEIEAALGYVSTKADTDGDGILDGLEDKDNDGLPNAGEVLAETDPNHRDTDGDGILDGAEDQDGDGLINAREFAAGTLPNVADTDVDGWNDESEVTAGSNPVDPGIRPAMLLTAAPSLKIAVAQLRSTGLAGTYVGQPRVTIGLPSLEHGPNAGLFVGQPRVAIGLPSHGSDFSAGLVLGLPRVTLGITGLQRAGADLGLSVAQPPLKINLKP